MIYDTYGFSKEPTWHRHTPERRVIRKMLLVDDDPLFAKTFSRVAARNGFLCDSVTDMDTLFTNWPREDGLDVIVLDYNLMDVRGTELAPLFPNTPVVMISSTLDWIEPETISCQNMVSFVCKGDGMNAILSEVQRSLQQHPFLWRNSPRM